MKVYAATGMITHTVRDDAAFAEVARQLGECVLVPCHRVVGRDGKLTGYAGGLRRKRSLLDLEDWGQLW